MKHTVKVGGKIVELAWNTTTGAWSIVSPRINNGIDFVLEKTGKIWQNTSDLIKKYFPKTHGMIGEGAKPVRESPGDVHHIVLFGVQTHAPPLTISGGTEANIHKDVENCSGEDPNQFGFGVRRPLKVKAPYGSLCCRQGLVFLLPVPM